MFHCQSLVAGVPDLSNPPGPYTHGLEAGCRGLRHLPGDIHQAQHQGGRTLGQLGVHGAQGQQGLELLQLAEFLFWVRWRCGPWELDPAFIAIDGHLWTFEVERDELDWTIQFRKVPIIFQNQVTGETFEGFSVGLHSGASSLVLLQLWWYQPILGGSKIARDWESKIQKEITLVVDSQIDCWLMIDDWWLLYRLLIVDWTLLSWTAVVLLVNSHRL